MKRKPFKPAEVYKKIFPTHLQEIKELESQIQNETVVLRDDSKRSLDMDEIVESVKNQYANMATRTREEAENWNKRKVRQT